MSKSKIILVGIISVIVGAICASIYFTCKSGDDSPSKKDGDNKTEMKPKESPCSHGCQHHSHNEKTPCSTETKNNTEEHKHEEHKHGSTVESADGHDHKHEDTTKASCKKTTESNSSNTSESKPTQSENPVKGQCNNPECRSDHSQINQGATNAAAHNQ